METITTENMINPNATAMVNSNTLEEIKAVALPEKTDTYQPVAHEEVISYVLNELSDKLPQFKLQDINYGLSQKGQCLFGMATFSNGNKYMGPSIAFRNSYNKEFSLGFAFGSQVFVCANGMFTGDIVVAKKHTTNVWSSMREVMDVEIANVEKSYKKLETDVSAMKEIAMPTDEGFKALGLLRGKEVLTPRVFEKAMKEFIEPTYYEHKDGTALQLYNACTEGLKLETNPARAMSQRILLHDEFSSIVLPN
tara:strand:- start:20820 stop:21575 length:756 start_codon:yes stop_codon:yes gene_type:complete